MSFFSQISPHLGPQAERNKPLTYGLVGFEYALVQLFARLLSRQRNQKASPGGRQGAWLQDFLPTSNSTCWSLPPTSTNIRFGAFLGFVPAPLSNKHPQRAYISSRHRNFEPENCKKKRGQEIMILKQQLGKETQVDSDLAIWRWHQVGLPSPLASTIWKGLVWIFWMCFLQKRLMEITWKSTSKGWGDMEMMETTYVWFGHRFFY